MLKKIVQYIRDLFHNKKSLSVKKIDDSDLLEKIIDVKNVPASLLMVPRVDAIAVDIESCISDVLAVFKQNPMYAALPVYCETLDDIVGFINIADIFNHFIDLDSHGKASFEQRKITNLVKDALFVSPTIRSFELLVKMHTTNTTIALVVDEFGGIDGVIAMVQIMNEFLGKIQEIDDPVHPQILPRTDGTYIADARIHIEELQEKTGVILSLDEYDDSVQTLGGLLASFAGRVPAIGELLTFKSGCEFEIKDADPTRIKQVLIRIAPKRIENA